MCFPHDDTRFPPWLRALGLTLLLAGAFAVLIGKGCAERRREAGRAVTASE